MSWLRDVVAPKIKALIGNSSPTIESNIWKKCPSCNRMIHTKELEEGLMICGYCSYHFKLSPQKRFNSLFDDEIYEEVEAVKIKDDPINYRDVKRYIDRLKDAKKSTGHDEAISIAIGAINNIKSIVFVMDFSFMGGSMGLSVGKSVAKAVDIAISNNIALVGFTASGGARMQEGMLSLMQMPATVAALCKLQEAKLPYINVFTNPTTGGVLASFAMLGDIHIAEPNALIGFAGSRVIENTIRKKLPEGFQKSEFAIEHGMIDMIVDRRNMKKIISDILHYTMCSKTYMI